LSAVFLYEAQLTYIPNKFISLFRIFQKNKS